MSDGLLGRWDRKEIREVALPESDWVCPEIPQGINLRDGVKAVDLETQDLGFKENLGPGWAFPDKGKIVGVSIKHENGYCGYFPIGHDRGGNMPRELVLEWLEQDVLSGGTVVGHNLKYDMGWLRRAGVKITAPKIADTMILAALTHPEWPSFSLDNVSKKLGRKGKSKSLLYDAAKAFGHSDPMLILNLLPPGYVGPYGEGDVAETLAVYQELLPLVDRNQLNYVYQLETDLVPILVEMRWRGVPVNTDLAEQKLKSIRQQIGILKKSVYDKSGVHIDPWDAESIARALNTLGIDVPRTTRGGPSITQGFLDTLEHPIAGEIRSMRSKDKITQFFTGHVLGHAVNGHIHCELNQLRDEEGYGTVTGRMSCVDPNLQQIPARTEEGKDIRRCFVPDDGYDWYIFDYSSQEPRWTVHWAAEAKLPGADEIVQMYVENPNHDIHAWAGELFGRPRKVAKALFLGMVYCKGGASLCDELNLPTELVKPPHWDTIVPDGTPGAVRIAGAEGKKMISDLHEALPFLKKLQKMCEEGVNRHGVVRTASGRRVAIHSPNGQFDYKGVNYKVQGSAADQMKDGLRCVAREGFIPRLSVHDEMDFVDLEKDQVHSVSEIMTEKAMHGRVPAVVEVEFGRNWADVQDWKP